MNEEYDTNHPFALLPEPDRVKGGGYREWVLGPHAKTPDGALIANAVLRISPPFGVLKTTNLVNIGDPCDAITWKLTGTCNGKKYSKTGRSIWDTEHCAIFRDMIFQTWPTSPDGVMPPPRYRKEAV